MLEMNLLITGQMRDRDGFEQLLGHVGRHQKAFDCVALSTWTSELDAIQPIIADRYGFVSLLDAGNILPVAPILNRDIGSLLAQYRQISFGLRRLGSGRAIMRLRADDVRLCDVDLTELVRMVKSYWCETGKVTTFVKHAAVGTPCFFDDRFVVFSEKHIEKLLAYSLTDLLNLHQGNLFPEYLLHAPRYIGLSAELDGLLATDVRRVFSRPGSLNYRLGGFMQRDAVQKALERYRDEFPISYTFFADLAVDQVAGLRDYLVTSRFGVSSLKDFTLGVDAMIAGIAAEADQVPGAEALDKDEYKRTENIKTYAMSKLAQKEYALVVDYFDRAGSKLKTDSFMQEVVGIAMFYLHDKNGAYKNLHSSFAQGNRSFEVLFYLSAAAVDCGHQRAAYDALVALTDGTHPQALAAEHALNLSPRLAEAALCQRIIDQIRGNWSGSRDIFERATSIAARGANA